MAPGKTAVEFDAIINQDRQRRKNEALAKEIFGNGKGRRSSAPGAGIANRKPGTGPSLASRIGVQKRTTANTPKAAQKQQSRPNTKPGAGNVDAEWTHDLHTLNNPSASRAKLPPNGPRASKASRNDRIYNALNTSSSSPALNSQFNIVSSPKPSAGISIRGLAGPYVVMAKNFAFGTTAADIESAMTPVGGIALSCRLIAERPTVIAEIIFETKEGADNVVDTFNNQNADGHLLKVYHKVGGLPPSAKITTAQPAPVQSAPRSGTPLGPRAGVASDRSDDTRSDTRYGNSDRYAPRDRSRERRGEYPRDEVMDGSFGFDDRMDTDEREDNSFDKGRGLYSDSMINRNNGRGRRTYR